MSRVVLVTGVGRDIGGWFAQRLAADPDVEHVIGVDIAPPQSDLGDVAYVKADIRSTVIAEVISAEAVDTVVHVGVIATPSRGGGRARMKEINVIGTMQLLASCQRAAGVQRLVVKSSAGVYGASPNDPALFSEDTEPRRPPRSDFAKDSTEVEGYVRGFARRRPDVLVTMLRYASLIGPQVETSLTRYFSLPVVPTVLGFDPRLQFCHQDDAVAALHHSTLHGVDGTFNIAGDGVIMLSQAIRRLGRPGVAVPSALFATLGSTLSPLHSIDFSAEQRALLMYGRGLDTTKMRSTLGFEPSATSAQAFASFAERVGPGLLSSERLDVLEEYAAAALSKAEF